MLLSSTTPTGSGSAPNAIAGLPGTTVAYVANSGTNEVLKIDTSTQQVVARAQLPAGSDPLFLTAQNNQTVWVTLLMTNQLARVTFP